MNAVDLTINVVYLVAAFLFIFGLKRMSSPVTARNGIVVAGVGMLVAVLVSFLYALEVPEAVKPHLQTNLILAVVALLIGVIWAYLSGKRVAMTAMPQMIAIYNGLGGATAALIAAAELFAPAHPGASPSSIHLIVMIVGGFIGAISFSGSAIAWAKLDGRIRKTWRVPGQQFLNGLVMLVALALGFYAAFGTSGQAPALFVVAFFIVTLILGIIMTMPIGGADMPVVISLYNALTGLAVGLDGFVLQNPAMMIAGMVVGAAGTLLTLLMAKAMNRSVRNVIFSNFAAVSGSDSEIEGSLKPTDARDAAVQMRYASKVIVAPGYGLAVAQAQHKLYEFVKLLQDAGVDVQFAIHPVAGRMPGHMNVLLAEAGVPYDIIHDMEDINGEFKDTDVALVIGANDTVNPAARTNKSSPIYGMPVLNVDQARQVYVVKRGQGKGYSGVENELFYRDNTNMVYGDAQKVMVQMIQAIKDLGET
ncbi:MAG TPA: NAD(P)(+) transhydrogenase (Re/Si-specific) subunit beta [Nevskiaceae bacterium]